MTKAKKKDKAFTLMAMEDHSRLPISKNVTFVAKLITRQKNVPRRNAKAQRQKLLPKKFANCVVLKDTQKANAQNVRTTNTRQVRRKGVHTAKVSLLRGSHVLVKDFLAHTAATYTVLGYVP